MRDPLKDPDDQMETVRYPSRRLNTKVNLLTIGKETTDYARNGSHDERLVKMGLKNNPKRQGLSPTQPQSRGVDLGGIICGWNVDLDGWPQRRISYGNIPPYRTDLTEYQWCKARVWIRIVLRFDSKKYVSQDLRRKAADRRNKGPIRIPLATESKTLLLESF